MIGLIMAGGSGTRFWPLSRKSKPKQFLSLFNDTSMIQLTYKRLLSLINNEDIYVITTIDQARLVHQHLPLLPKQNIIIEPCPMNTAACVAYSVNYLLTKYKSNSDLLIVPSDQLIKEDDIFQSAVLKAQTLSQNNYHVVFGITPTYPATGYGYIEQGEELNNSMFHVKHFKEKPDYETAQAFINSGSYYWNCGMFLWTLETINKSFSEYYQKGYDILSKISKLEYNINNFFKIKALYKTLARMPIDIAIMEKVSKRALVPLNISWSDVGSWYSLQEVLEKDLNNNCLFSKNISINATNNLVYSKKLVSLVDIDNIILVETDDSILLLPRTSSEKVKDVVDILKQNNFKKYL